MVRTPRTSIEPWALAALLSVGILISGLSPHDRTVWLLEIVPVALVLGIIVGTLLRFPLTPTTYRLLFIAGTLMAIGAHYCFARVPIGNMVQDWLDLSRNHYDRLGHFFQGAAPALLIRELLIRVGGLQAPRLLFVSAVLMTLGISAGYELIEWAIAVVAGSGTEPFLGAQGDPWDPQWDMFMALSGSVAGLLLLRRQQDRELKQKDDQRSHVSA